MRFKVFSHLKQLFEVTQHTAWGLCFHSCGNSSKAFPLGLALCCDCRRVGQTLDNFRKGRMKRETVIFDEVEPKKWSKVNKWSTLESALPRWAIYLRTICSPCNFYTHFKRGGCRGETQPSVYMAVFSRSTLVKLHKTERVYGLARTDTWSKLQYFWDGWNLSKLITSSIMAHKRHGVDVR